MDKTFGFDTAVEEAQRAINSAYIEVGRYFFLACFNKETSSEGYSMWLISSVFRHVVHIMELGWSN